MGTPDVTELLSDLIRVDSVTGSAGEGLVLDLVQAWYAGHAGSRVVRSPATTDGLLVVPARPSPRSSGPHLAFSCHADVVPTGAEGSWTTPPFQPHIAEGRLHGRGSSDMKAGLAAAMVAVARLHEQGLPVVLALSVGEESGCLGAPVLVDMLSAAGIDLGAVVIPESTANRIVLGHRGALWLRVETRGTSAHGSTPSAGRNAVLAMRDVLLRLDAVPLTAHPRLGAETLNVGTIAGGSVPNMVPDVCVVRVDHRVTEAASAARIPDWWRGRPDVADVTVELDLAPVWTDETDPWVASLPGRVAREPAAYFTDASVFVRSMPDVPMVVWGPGDPTRVHSVDESVSLDLLADAVLAYVSAGVRWAASPV
ncbi:M20 family peptidase [Curtobacterium sp. MCBD17_034]|uniref:M20 family metallopeptidase n=1 Tax=unclassified Curtobacterium TaxID=257496 RepID=UPI000DA921D6|nr:MULTISPECIES: M20 family metallopeptidase [unclassified Curtobacterium]PZF62064.1 M20 family peptidase [Curtobacterium sp. MCBD17_034]PZM34003.1 M20 family peptidase [Curtobacterium sp. MCBD17_031]